MHFMCLEVGALTKLKTSTLQSLSRSSGNCRREAIALFDRKGTSGTPVQMQQSKFLLVSVQAMPPFSQSHILQPTNYLFRNHAQSGAIATLRSYFWENQTLHGNMYALQTHGLYVLTLRELTIMSSSLGRSSPPRTSIQTPVSSVSIYCVLDSLFTCGVRHRHQLNLLGYENREKPH